MSGPEYRTPGVYVEEISNLPPSVASVPTAVAAFVGYTEKDDTGGAPTRISSLIEYQNHFGTATAQQQIEINVTDTTTNPVKITFPTTGKKPALHSYLYYSIQLFFMNGGGDCYVVSVGPDTSTADKATLKSGLDKLEVIDEPTLLVIPDTSILADDTAAITLMNEMLDQCAKLQNRFAILDVRTSPEVFRSSITSDTAKAKFGAAYYPDLVSVLSYRFSDDTVTVLSSGGKTLTEIKTTDNILYNKIQAALNAVNITVPPSGAVAGIYNTMDNNRGVWKAPANAVVLGVRYPSIAISAAEQEGLNVNITGKSINAIREFPGKGILIWGARTLSGNDNEWRYVSVRRFFIMVEQSLKKSTTFLAFEPNDANAWTKARTMIENYLTELWRQGALQGAKPDNAYFVNVGLGQTMTSVDILEGRMIIVIGLAVVRPAEFIILQIVKQMQMA
jgi:uncharacterized protein